MDAPRVARGGGEQHELTFLPEPLQPHCQFLSMFRYQFRGPLGGADQGTTREKLLVDAYAADLPSRSSAQSLSSQEEQRFLQGVENRARDPRLVTAHLLTRLYGASLVQARGGLRAASL